MHRIVAVLLALGATALFSATALASSNGVYVEQTGHHLSGAFLDYWDLNGGPRLFGYPITEEFTVGGSTYQYFQKARFEWRGDGVVIGKIAVDLGASQPGVDSSLVASSGNGWRYFPETGHLVGGGFHRFFEANGGVEYFGVPITSEVPLGDRTVQYFERARMEWDGSTVFLAFLGTDLARRRGISTSSVERWQDLAVWSGAIGIVPGAAPPANSGKTIVVNLTQQRLYTYENGELLLSTPVTTGRPELATPTGNFAVASKQTDFWFVSPWGTDSPWWYESVMSSYAMYYAAGGYYIHDAPWRADFGPGTNQWHEDSSGEYVTGSHGCINVPFASMKKIFAWADGGTAVTVTY